jgi:chromosome segregation ATPase
LRQRVDAERADKETMERHLAGLLASPAIAKVASPPMQYPSVSGDGSAEDDQPSTTQHLPEGDPTAELVHLRSGMHALKRELDEASHARHAAESSLAAESSRREQVESALRDETARREHAELYLTQLQSEVQHWQQLAQAHADSAQTSKDNLDHAQQQLQSQGSYLSQLAASLAEHKEREQQKDAEVQRLQAELLRLNSIDHAPSCSAISSSATAATNDDPAALRHQLAQLRAELSQQAALAVEEKKRTQAMLNEKLESNNSNSNNLRTNHHPCRHLNQRLSR